MVWVDISNRCIYIQAILSSIEVRGSQFGHLYKRMLRATLATFCPDSNYIFWPNLADYHYSKQTVALMNENVYFVPKDINPPNVPQERPIENFWGCLAQKVCE